MEELFNKFEAERIINEVRFETLKEIIIMMKVYLQDANEEKTRDLIDKAIQMAVYTRTETMEDDSLVDELLRRVKL